jgi:hypothetical protein
LRNSGSTLIASRAEKNPIPLPAHPTYKLA